MKALVLSGNGVALSETPRPAIGRDEVLIRVLVAGVCGTDHFLLKNPGDFRGVLGHEFVGEIETTGPNVTQLESGQRIVADINFGCGECRMCMRKHGRLCLRRTALGIDGEDGAFAQWIKLPAANCVVVPDHVDLDEAVFAEPIAAALRIRHQISVKPEQTLLVLGAGRLGQIAARVLAHAGLSPLTAVRDAAKRDVLLSQGVNAVIGERVESRSIDTVIECSGTESGFLEAQRIVAPGGRIMVKSTFATPPRVDFAALVIQEIAIIGSRCGSMSEAIGLLATSKTKFADLISARYPLEEYAAAFERSARRDTVKVVFDL